MFSLVDDGTNRRPTALIKIHVKFHRKCFNEWAETMFLFLCLFLESKQISNDNEIEEECQVTIVNNIFERNAFKTSQMQITELFTHKYAHIYSFQLKANETIGCYVIRNVSHFPREY